MTERQHTVEGGVLRRSSVSQLMTYDERQDGGCARKWYIEKVLGIKRPEDPALKAGEAFHKEIERYLGGEITAEELSPTIRAGVHLMPQPCDPLLLIEQPIDGVLDLGGVPFIGRIDCVNRSNVYIDALGAEQEDPIGTVEIVDWKSTANLKYAKRGADLIDNPQMIGYAEYVRRRYNGAIKFIRMSHVAFQKRGSFSAQKNTALFSVEVVRERWQSLIAVIDQMKATAKLASVAEVKPNYSACDKFKGCPYRNVCPRSSSAVLGDYFGNKGDQTMGLFKDKAKQANETTNTPVVVQQINTVTPGVSRNPSDAAIAAETAKLVAEEKAAQGKAPEVFGDCKACGAVVTAVNGSRTISGKIKHISGCAASIVTEDQKQPEGAPGQPLDGSRDVPPSIQAAAEKLGLDKPAPAVVAPPANEQESGKKARKPREPKNAAAPSPVPAQGNLPQVAGNFAHALLINARLAKGGFVFWDANEIVADIIGEVCRHFNADDLEFAAKDSPLAFGGWRGALRVAVAEHEAFSNAGVYVLQIRTDAERVAAEALRRRFAVVIDGTD